MFVMFLVVGGIYLLLGDRIEVFVFLLFVVLLIMIMIVQEVCIENVFGKLCDLLVLCVLVICDGVMLCILGREVVEDDILVFEQGDCVFVDVLFIEVCELEVDEVFLIGELVLVCKRFVWEGDEVGILFGGDDCLLVYVGLMLMCGMGIVCVVVIGLRSWIGQIG